jgi:acyl carrier protein
MSEKRYFLENGQPADSAVKKVVTAFSEAFRETHAKTIEWMKKNEELNVDSLGSTELALALEEKFDCDITDEEQCENLKLESTAFEVIDFMRQKIAKGSASTQEEPKLHTL